VTERRPEALMAARLGIAFAAVSSTAGKVDFDARFAR
jgi:hypothetical protein